jgi:hypothetical protein
MENLEIASLLTPFWITCTFFFIPNNSCDISSEFWTRINGVYHEKIMSIKSDKLIVLLFDLSVGVYWSAFQTWQWVEQCLTVIHSHVSKCTLLMLFTNFTISTKINLNFIIDIMLSLFIH